MAATNSTANLGLPQWVATDKPERTDFNTAMSDIDNTVAAHLAEDVSELIDISRDLSLNGDQIIGLSKGKIPKAIYALVTTGSLDTWSNGFSDENRSQSCIYKFKDDNRVARYSGYLIALSAGTTTNRKRASITSMTANQLVLNWSNVGTGVVDTANIQLLVMYHGGVA